MILQYFLKFIGECGMENVWAIVMSVYKEDLHCTAVLLFVYRLLGAIQILVCYWHSSSEKTVSLLLCIV